MKLSQNLKKLQTSRKNDLIQFQKNLTISFHSLELLNQALIHTSYANENPLLSKEVHADNERLEFLGDAVLEIIITEYLYKKMPFASEGELAKSRAAIVCEQSLAKIAMEIKLGSFLLLGKGEEKSGGREKKALLADSFEALIGALYLDSGFETAKLFILTNMTSIISQVIREKKGNDYKTLLQEFVQKKYQTTPVYTLVSESGPDHEKSFFISVSIDRKSFGPAQGKNKKEAELGAAKLASLYYGIAVD